jgi:HEAT repeat protein
LHALAQLSSVTGVQALLELAREADVDTDASQRLQRFAAHSSAAVRRSAARALGELGAVATLGKLLDDADASVRRAAAGSLLGLE